MSITYEHYSNTINSNTINSNMIKSDKINSDMSANIDLSVKIDTEVVL